MIRITPEQHAEYMKQITLLMTDDSPVLIESTVQGCYLVLLAFQTVSRHPAIGDEMRSLLRQQGQAFEDVCLLAQPLAAEIVRMGWDFSWEEVVLMGFDGPGDDDDEDEGGGRDDDGDEDGGGGGRDDDGDEDEDDDRIPW